MTKKSRLPRPYAAMPRAIFRDRRLGKNDYPVFGAILSRLDWNTGYCYVKREELSNITGLPLSTISTTTTHLVELGWLKKSGQGGFSAPCRYEFTLPPDYSETANCSEDEINVTKKTVTDLATTVLDCERGKNQLNQHKIESSGYFDEFWGSYPKKMNRPAAVKAWNKINPDPELANQIITSLQYAVKTRQWQQEGGRYIPAPARFLDEQCWEEHTLPEESAVLNRQNQNTASADQPLASAAYQPWEPGSNNQAEPDRIRASIAALRLQIKENDDVLTQRESV